MLTCQQRFDDLGGQDCAVQYSSNIAARKIAFLREFADRRNLAVYNLLVPTARPRYRLNERYRRLAVGCRLRIGRIKLDLTPSAENLKSNNDRQNTWGIRGQPIAGAGVVPHYRRD